MIAWEFTMSTTDPLLVQLYRLATCVTLNVIDDSAMLAFGLS